MNLTHTFAKDALEKVAFRHRATVEEVEKEIIRAIRMGKNSPDPVVRERWKEISCMQNEPTPEEVVEYLVKRIVEDMV